MAHENHFDYSTIKFQNEIKAVIVGKCEDERIGSKVFLKESQNLNFVNYHYQLK